MPAALRRGLEAGGHGRHSAPGGWTRRTGQVLRRSSNTALLQRLLQPRGSTPLPKAPLQGAGLARARGPTTHSIAPCCSPPLQDES